MEQQHGRREQTDVNKEEKGEKEKRRSKLRLRRGRLLTQCPT